MFYLIDTVSRKRSSGRVLSGYCRANTGTCGSLPDGRPLLLNTIADCTTSIQTTRPHTADDSIEYPIPPTLFGLIMISFIPFLDIENLVISYRAYSIRQVRWRLVIPPPHVRLHGDQTDHGLQAWTKRRVRFGSADGCSRATWPPTDR